MNTAVHIGKIFCPIIAGILLLIQVIVSNQLAALGKTLSALDQRISVANERHERLATEVASASSLLSIRVRAQQEGFRDPKSADIIALTSAVPVAFGVPARPGL